MIFLDSGNIKEIKKYMKMGVIRGVTTNPTIMKRDGVTDIDKSVKEISEIVYPYPLSVEVTSNNKKEIIKQSKHYSLIKNNINIKIPIHGPNGELEYLELINELSDMNITLNVTAMMSAQQGLLAMLAGAKYLSLFCGRINDMGYDSNLELNKLRKIIDSNKSNSEIIAASSREVYNIVDWIDNGAHIVTVSPNLLEKCIINPKSKETVKQFLDDAK